MTKNLLLICLAFSSILILPSCDDCRGLFGKEKVECSNGGTCNNGECDCLKGYYGDQCEQIDVCELKDVVCVYGECEEGICICTPGFEGDDCSISSREKYLGMYQVTEGCENLDTLTGHKFTIEENILNPAEMHIINMFNYNQFPVNGFFSKVTAVPTANSDKFQIPNQQPDGNGRTIQGSGSITQVDSVNIVLEMDYKVKKQDGTEFNCTVQANFINP